ncbi:MAG: Fe-S cluster assembly scaffold protein NifU [Candidatus Altiarchaeota archaeon]|nr:Fe-S cluster assembly scaffold protein NifU [Candidatus Altiarchaeota archaeon]
MYTSQVMEHFTNPKNVGEIKDADGVGEVGNMRCGDIMWIYIKVKDDRIYDVKFKTLGCAAAIATSSVTTELAKGKTLEEALKITNQTIIDSLGGLPSPKIHCSLLAVDGLKEAIYDYLKKANKAIPEELMKHHKSIEAENSVCH